jgi:DNA-directed RNA polymerase II subunit RPB7
MHFNPSANPPAYASDEQSIEKGSRVRLKIVGVRADVGKMFAM